jgi:hypothetical protein
MQGIPSRVNRIIIYKSFFFARAAFDAEGLPCSIVVYNRAIFQQNEGFASSSTMFGSFWLHSIT